MISLRKRPRELPEQHVSEPAANIVETERWTYGQTLKNRLFVGAFIVAAAGTLIGASVAITKSTEREPVVIHQASVDVTHTDQSAAAYAVGYLRVWLNSTETSHEALDGYTGSLAFSAPKLPVTASGVGQIQVAKSTPHADGSYVVTLSAQLGDVPQQRYFEIVVLPHEGGFAAAALPREVASPKAQSVALPGYSKDVAGDPLIGQTLDGFFSAYLTGNGDLLRFIAPGAQVQPITPAPYEKATVTAAYADAEVPAAPADGTHARLLVRVIGLGAKGYQISSDYELSLTARAGRWEISTMGAPTAEPSQPAAPTSASAPPSSTSSPSAPPPNTTTPSTTTSPKE